MRYLAAMTIATIFFGQSVSDPYRYLEDAQSARTTQWIDAQNTQAERSIDAYPGNARIAHRVEELSLTGARQFDPQLAGDTLFFMREVPPQPQPVLVAQSWPQGTPHVVLDPATLGPAVSIDFVWPSPNGRLLAVGTASGGSESTSIRVVETSSGHVYDENLGPAGGGTTAPAVAWDANGQGFVYGRLPANGSQFGIELYHHVVGTTQARDTLSLGAISPVAEYQLLTSAGAHHAAALVTFGDGSFYRIYRRSATAWDFAIGAQAGITSGAFVRDRLLLVATAGSPHGRIAALRADNTLETVVPQQADWAFHDIAPIRGGFLVTKSWGMRWRVDQYDNAGRMVRTVGLPQSGIGIDAIASDDEHASAIIAYEGWTGPALRWVSYDGQTGAMQTIYDLNVASKAYADVRVHELTATSKDGTAVPVTVLALAGTPQDGSAPTILTGYGGFGLAIPPHFIGSTLAWLEMGGVLAVATIRGGSEFGESWHQQGMLANKQNVFDDFYASAQALISNKWTSRSRLGIEGGSNGGLLVGAALVQHPQEYRAVVSFAGIYDMLRYHLFPNGTYNITEYGSANDPAQFRALYAYSPYHHVEKGVAYPAVLLVTSENDPRVADWQSWKFGAALQAATSSGRPILILTHRSGGHGHGASYAQRVGNAAIALSFLASQLGLNHSSGP